MTEIPELLTIQQTADRLKCTRSTVYKLIAAGDLAVVKMSKVSRVSVKDLKEYIDRNTRVAS